MKNETYPGSLSRYIAIILLLVSFSPNINAQQFSSKSDDVTNSDSINKEVSTDPESIEPAAQTGKFHFTEKQLNIFERTRALNLSGKRATKEAVASLVYHQNLTFLNLSDTEINSEIIEGLRKLNKLEILILSGSNISDGLINQSILPAELVRLNLENTQITSKSLPAISKNKRLKYLNLARTNITDYQFDRARNLKRLEELDLSFTKIGGKTLETISRMPQMKELRLWGCPLKNNDIRSLQQSGLFELALGGTKISDEGLRYLSTMKNLEILHLPYTDISDNGIRNLTTIKSLKAINLNNTKITSAGIRLLSGLPELSILSIENTPVDNATLDALRQFENLNTVYMKTDKLSSDALKRFEKDKPLISFETLE